MRYQDSYILQNGIGISKPSTSGNIREYDINSNCLSCLEGYELNKEERICNKMGSMLSILVHILGLSAIVTLIVIAIFIGTVKLLVKCFKKYQKGKN